MFGYSSGIARICVAMLLPGAIFAQLSGTVVDPLRTPVQGARIEASCEGGLRATVAADDGAFTLDLAPGLYHVTVVSPGFASQEREVEAPGRLEFVLQLAQQRESVTVSERPGYDVAATSSATRIPALLRDVPQSVTVVTRELMADQLMMSVADVVRYVPGVTAIQGENNRDQLVIRGNSSSADFFRDGVRDDVQYYRDLYSVERVEALKGANALAFGRGGGGGVINRVAKEAGFTPLRELELVGGNNRNRRVAADWNQPLSRRVAVRLNGVYENSASFREFVGLERYGVTPTVTVAAGPNTRAVVSYEYFQDGRVADRGVPSFQGRPAGVERSQYFGNPADSRVRAGVNIGSGMIEHQAGRWNIRSRLLAGDYDRFYQNYVPGAVTADRARVAMSAYNNATRRRNVFNQTDFVHTGARHTVLVGVEAGRQANANFRNTGYFDGGITSIAVPYESPVLGTPAAFRQSASDADNHVRTYVAAVYAQDQVNVTRWLQVIGGVRVERFDLRFENNRNEDRLRRVDTMASPRAGVVVKPRSDVSLYASYGVTHLPSSGDQFSSLTTVTQQVKPERFNNYEAGVKWDLHRDLALTAAVYRLDRTNTRSTDPNDPARIVQTGSQRTNGFEAGWNGRITGAWSVAGGYGWQDAYVVRATVSARAGAQAAQVPHQTFSLWNHYRFSQRLAAGVGVVNRADMFAAIDNTVVLPGYTRFDAAAYYGVTERTRVQVNVENVTGRKYFANADGNNNISPGAGRGVRLGLSTRF